MKLTKDEKAQVRARLCQLELMLMRRGVCKVITFPHPKDLDEVCVMADVPHPPGHMVSVTTSFNVNCLLGDESAKEIISTVIRSTFQVAYDAILAEKGRMN